MRRSSALFALLVATSACSYHNVIFNAESLYREAEANRRAGRDSLSRTGYEEVIEKTGRALRARPGSEWSVDALYLLGRARLRTGDLRAARAALEEVEATTLDETRRGAVRVHLALLHELSGDPARALQVVNVALAGPLDDEARAEGHLLRGRLLATIGRLDEAWWDLDRASGPGSGLGVEAGIERLRWSVHHGERERGRRALGGLFREPGAASRADTISALVRSAERRWGPAGTADLLVGADRADWDRTVRGRLALERARMLDLAGDTSGARLQATRVAGGLGPAAAEARLLLSAWRMARARDLVDVYAVRGVLLPAGNDPRVARVLAAIDDLETYAGLGLDEPLGWFAAAEVARDRLGATFLARGLFLAYADAAPGEPWAPKALLAALQVSPDEGDRAWLRGRLEGHGQSPYVLAARGGTAAGFGPLEEELDVRLRALTRR